MVKPARSTGPSQTAGAPSGCGHPDCDPDECWNPSSAVTGIHQSPRRRPAWVTPPRLVERRRCSGCKAQLWEAWDADLMAGRARVDAGVFLTAEGESRALARGRRTWEYETFPSRRIEFRDEWRRTGRPAGRVALSAPVLVVVEHVCGRPTPKWARYSPPRVRSTASTAEPPF